MWLVPIKKYQIKLNLNILKKNIIKKDTFLKELEAKDDAKRITNAIKEILSFEEIKTFYNDVRKFHYGSEIEKILDK
jgi:uncharacterized membrane protein YgaE (UPF0421/DUF939 family)